ncbi:hypothetical protein RCL1_007245 [Eukaryota sp. TZLM3-RCL]
MASDKCELMGWFSVVVQSLMGFVAFSALVYQRYREVPRKPWLLWFYDSSKSGLAALLQHFLNIAISLVFGSTEDSSCGWYVIVSSADTFLGVFINFLLHRFVQNILVTRKNKLKFKSGYYGPDPNSPQLSYYLCQLSVWLGIVVISKIILAICMRIWLPFLQVIVKLVMSPFSGHPFLELLFVMLVVPLFLNLFYFLVTYQMLRLGRKSKSTPDYSASLPLVDEPTINSDPFERVAITNSIPTWGDVHGALFKPKASFDSLSTSSDEEDSVVNHGSGGRLSAVKQVKSRDD